MGRHTVTLKQLVAELHPPARLQEVRRLALTQPLDLAALKRIDHCLGGPHLEAVSRNGRGCFAASDRDVFRPLQYCAVYFAVGAADERSGWITRDIVRMSCLYVESLVKRIGGCPRSPLGHAINKRATRRALDSDTLGQLSRLNGTYNDAKHSCDHDKDTHMFSNEDAVVAYFVCRGLGARLYPAAGLATDFCALDAG